MFENEEKQLRDIKSELDDLHVPEEALNDAIQQGFLIAGSKYRAKRQSQRKSLWTIAITAVLLLTFVTSIRVSPAFANAVGSIPIVGKLVDLIQYDKGLQGIFDNDYYQEVEVSQTVDDIKLTINGVIVDETGMVVSYTLEAPYSIKRLGYKDYHIYKDGEEIEKGSWSYGYPDQKNQNRKEDVMEFMFSKKQTFDTRNLAVEITLDNEKETTFSIPFTLPKEVKKGKVYLLNQEVEVEGQKMTIREITISPLRVAVNIVFDKTNTMRILNFEDMRIEDEKGEEWSSIRNGTSGRGFGDEERTLYLQSNYFENPEKLFFKMNQMQALPKEEAYLLVDLQKGKVLKQPIDGIIEVTAVNPDSVEARYKQKEEAVNHFLFFTAENAKGEEVESNGSSSWQDEEYKYSAISFTRPELLNPVKITFSYYPNYINDDISIEIE